MTTFICTLINLQFIIYMYNSNNNDSHNNMRYI